MRWRYALELLTVFLLAGGLAYDTQRSSAQAISSVTLSAPLNKPEAWDYATRVWGDPWDMVEPSDVYLVYTSCPTPVGSGYRNVTVSDGIWSGTVESSPGQMVVLNPGYASSLDVPQDGQTKPVNADAYPWITFRLYSSQNTAAAFYWMKGNLSEFPRYGVSEVFAISQGWSIYTMHLPSLLDTTPPLPIGTEPWSGAITGLRFDVFGTNAQVKLDWMRISQAQTGNTVSWSGTEMSGSVEIAFDNGDGSGFARLRYFPSGKSEASISTGGTGGSFDVPASFAPGRYTARVTGSGVWTDSTDQWSFQAAPIAQILAPSYVSGEDWATTVAGNPWDMGGTDDVSAGDSMGVTYNASDGVLHITNAQPFNDNPCYPDWPHRPLALNLHNHAIDSNKYKYLSFRYKVDQAPDQGAGGVSRVRWQIPSGDWPTGRTDDISLYNNGWIVYELDLPTVPLEVEGARWADLSYRILQILVNESHLAWTSHLDWVKLTAENVARGSYVVSWEMVQGQASTTTLYWDDDRNPGNGFASRAYRTAVVPADPPSGPHLAYLPLITRNYGFGQSTFTLSTEDLAYGGTYYVALKVEDGYSTVYWYSELPVRKIP